MARLIHTMLRVKDLETSIAFYRDAFDLDAVERYEASDFILVFLRNCGSEMEIELTYNKGREEAYNVGDGFGHLAVSVDDLDAQHRRLTEMGLAPTDIVEMKDGDQVGARLCFVRDPDGYAIEVLDRIGRLAD